jgi:hypothetical protein
MRILAIGCAALVSGALWSCYPDEIDSLTDAASVITVVDSQQPLRIARTYAMPDTIIHSLRAQGTNVIGHEADPQVLARIRANFSVLGWREITDLNAERPDVAVLVMVFEQTNTGVAYAGWWGDWGYWPGFVGYGPDWAWGYPSAVTFNFESGTLAIAMLDLRGGNPTFKNIPLLWIAGIEGAVITSSIGDVLNGIDQAFAQSPYLERQ